MNPSDRTKRRHIQSHCLKTTASIASFYTLSRIVPILSIDFLARDPHLLLENCRIPQSPSERLSRLRASPSRYISMLGLIGASVKTRASGVAIMGSCIFAPVPAASEVLMVWQHEEIARASTLLPALCQSETSGSIERLMCSALDYSSLIRPRILLIRCQARRNFRPRILRTDQSPKFVLLAS